MGMKVWIDQDLCTGDGLCEEIAPDVFTLLDDGLAYVREGAKVFSDPGGPEGLARNTMLSVVTQLVLLIMVDGLVAAFIQVVT